MSRTLNTQIVARARSLIDDELRWCRGELAKDASGNSVFPLDWRAQRRCAFGAFIAAAYEISGNPKVADDLAVSAVRSICAVATLVNVNDVRGHAAVLALLDGAPQGRHQF